jgi:inner membrane protein
MNTVDPQGQYTPQPTENVPPPPPPRLGWLRGSLSARALVVGILVLLLLIPLGMVGDLIRERADRKEEAAAGISSDWGGAQTITGPVIDVPYDEVVRVAVAGGYEDRTVTHYIHFLPALLNVEAGLDPHVKHRGIYEVPVYASRTLLTGRFDPFSTSGMAAAQKMRWKDARLVIGISDLRSIKEQVELRIGDRTVQLEPGLHNADVTRNGLSVAFPLDESMLDQPLEFSTTLAINGCGTFNVVPVGKVTTATCSSSWNDPSFTGAFLPDPREPAAAAETGFRAKWKVLHLNRPYPQEFTGSRLEAIEESAFGVWLMQPVDEYHKNERASKYGIMLIVLVFLVFFFVEVLQQLRIHPIQYLLVGFALCVFYTLLIAISEHLGFAWAYIISACATVVLVVVYAHGVFQVRRASQLLGLIMLLVFGFMFTLINQQDLALLYGSIGLFITLALVMWVSRRIDWNGTRQE